MKKVAEYKKTLLAAGIILAASAACTGALSFPTSASAAEPIATNNNGDNGYAYYSYDAPSRSFIDKTSTGYQRAEFVSENKIFYEDYNTNFMLTKQATIPKNTYMPSVSSGEDFKFGGIYFGSQYNFIITGQNNYAEKDTIPVVRVSKYSKDWSFIDFYEMYGENTVQPFHAGFSAVEVGTKLIVHTSHEMYKSGDGYNHQASMNFAINEETMELYGNEKQTGVYNHHNQAKYGYVSHSFAQLSTTLNNNAYIVDQGDMYPRSVTLKKWGSEGYEELLNIAGAGGNNFTGVELGGMSSSSTKNTILVVGRSIDQTKFSTSNYGSPMGIWLSVTKVDSQGKLVEGGSTLKWLQSYGRHVNPQITKLSENLFVVAWHDTDDYNFNYQLIDGNGNTVSTVKQAHGALSDCVPINDGSYATWYFTGVFNPSKATTPMFIKLGQDDSSLTIAGPLASMNDVTVELVSGDPVKWTGYALTPEIKVKFNGYNMIDGVDYQTFYSDNINPGLATITLSGKGAFDRRYNGYSFRIGENVMFNDVFGSTPHYEDILWLAGTGISTGWVDGDKRYYRGTNTVLRQDMAAFLYRLAGSPEFDETKVANPFVDVNALTPHYKEILWCAHVGISEGWLESNGKKTFRGTNTVLRQDMAAFLRRTANKIGVTEPSPKEIEFDDVDSSTPHSEDIEWLAETGVSTGWLIDEKYYYMGTNEVLRQDMAAFLHRIDNMRTR